MSAQDFRTTYGAEPAGVWSAPGRVNLIGEHTDYNDGFVLPFAIEARTCVAAAPRDDGLLRMRSAQQPDGDLAVALEDLAPGHPDGWSAYVAGIVWAARQAGHAVGGLDVMVDGRVPLGGGLSSSHALECGVALAVNDIAGLGLDVPGLARLTQLAENEFVGAPTGLMDQLASLACTEGHALFLDVRSLEMEQVPLDPAGDGLALLVIDTRVHHELGDGAYADRRSSCEEAARLLGVPSLRDVPAADLESTLRGLPDVPRRRARHVVTENSRVLDAVQALHAGDWPRLGDLMRRSHESMRDDFEISCAELDTAVEAATSAGAVGARMTGGGFGGSAVALVPAALVPVVTARVTAAFAQRGFREPSVFAVRPSAGAGRDS